MGRLIDTKPIMLRIKEELKNEIAQFKNKPKFTIVSVGNVESNNTYVRNKATHCADIGIEVNHVHLPRETTQNELMNRIINEQIESHSLILQLPLDCENEIDINRVLNLIQPEKDVDGLTSYNQGKLFSGHPFLAPATPLACMKLLEEFDYDVEGRNVLVLGRSQLLGKPLAQLLEQANATVTIAHSKSQTVYEDMEEGFYDVVISCVGKPHEFKNINADILIDCGINFKNDRMVGDVNIDTCSYEYASIPPSKDRGIKGGVGSLTCMCLIENIIKSYKLQGGN